MVINQESVCVNVIMEKHITQYKANTIYLDLGTKFEHFFFKEHLHHFFIYNIQATFTDTRGECRSYDTTVDWCGRFVVIVMLISGRF